MKKLLIYVPTYNRASKLQLCIERLIAEIDGLEDRVIVHVSDNGSTDGTAELLAGVKHPAVQFSRNQENIGLPRNILKCHDLAHLAEFTWAIGDDDVILAGGVRRLLAAFETYPDSDLFFLNTVAYGEEKKADLLPRIIANGYTVNEAWGPTKSSVKQDFQCTFRELFDPRIDAVFLGSLMCYAWRSSRVSNRIPEQELSKDFSQPKACYHVALNYLYCLPPTAKCSHLHAPFTVNFWHEGVDWGNDGLALAVTQGLGIILYEAIRLGHVGEADRHRYFVHYLNIASKAYKRFLEAGTFRDRLANFHGELAEMALRYGLTPLYPTPKKLSSKLADASPRKVLEVLGGLLTRIRPSRFLRRSAE